MVSTGSRLLFQALDGIYAALGFGALGDDVFRDLVLAWVVEPTSVLDTGRVLADLGREAASDKTMRRTLARCAGRGYRDKIAGLCFAHARASGDISLVLYDVTTLYFEAGHEDACARPAIARSGGPARRSWPGCSSAGTGSPSRSAASRGTKRRSSRSCQ